MPTMKQRQALAEILAELRAAVPTQADRYRLSKMGESIAYFEPGVKTGELLYSTYLGSEEIVYCVVNGKTLSCKPHEYEGFPDPPPPEPQFKVGDRVTRKAARISGGRYLRGRWVTSWDEPERTGLVVTRVEVKQFEASREWHVRVSVTDPAGKPGNYEEAGESSFALEAAADTAA